MTRSYRRWSDRDVFYAFMAGGVFAAVLTMLVHVALTYGAR